jgi:RimJ/RimL family protein N-acetyltransferase
VATVVALRRYTDADFALTAALETDPEVMRELGGPLDEVRLPDTHRRRLADPWWFTIVVDAEGPGVGSIGVWEAEHDGTTIHETGWMVLPAFQGRGIASQALTLLIERVRAAPGFTSIHAFPPTSNGPSNALCRKFGFALLEPVDGSYAGRELHCNHWELAVGATAPRASSSTP